MERYRGYNIIRFFRGDVAFADPNIYCCLEAGGYCYAIGPKGNDVLDKKLGHLMTCPVG